MRYCAFPRCQTTVNSGYCAVHTRKKPSASRYNLAQWKRLRLDHLRQFPLCMTCLAEGLTVAATVVHHIRAHRGDMTLLLDPTNLESLCKTHHDVETGKGR